MEVGSSNTLLVIGAAGFLGRATVAAALEADCHVRALTRRAVPADGWGAGVSPVVLDLSAASAASQGALDAALEGVTAVIHAAAAMSGNDAVHARDTLAPTAALIEAMLRQPVPPRLVLISSLSVYGYAALPDGATLDETVPLEPDPAFRDAYARAKLGQEALAVRAAQQRGLSVRILRPGAIVGPGRLRTARLGLAVGPLLLMPGGAAPVPAIAVEDCAALAVAAATRPLGRPDLPPGPGGGHVEAINAVDPAPLTQGAYAARLARGGWPRKVVRLPLGLARAPARAAGLAAILLPGLVRRLPGLLRPESFEARFKPLHPSAARAEDRLGWRPARPFAETLATLAETRKDP